LSLPRDELIGSGLIEYQQGSNTVGAAEDILCGSGCRLRNKPNYIAKVPKTQMAVCSSCIIKAGEVPYEIQENQDENHELQI
jgi:hypothetical protein